MLLLAAVLLGLVPALVAVPAREAEAAACRFVKDHKQWTLRSNCTTSKTIVIPNGITLDGLGKTIRLAGSPQEGYGAGIASWGGRAKLVNVTIDRSQLTGSCSFGVFYGVFFSNNRSARIDRVHVTGGMNQTTTCEDVGIAVYGTGGGSTKAKVTRSTVSEVRVDGIRVHSATVAVNGSTVTTASGARYGIEAAGNDVSVTNNAVQGPSFAQGIESWGGGPIVIAGNRLEGGGIHIYSSSGVVSTIRDNTVTGANLGILIGGDLQSGPATVTNNRLSNVSKGIYLSGSVETTVADNTITGRGPIPNFNAGIQFDGAEAVGYPSGIARDNAVSNFFSSTPGVISCGIFVEADVPGVTLGAGNTFPDPPGNQQDVCDQRPTSP